MKIDKVCSILSLVLVTLQLLLILFSWVLTAAIPESNLRSILSNEGIRWFFGHFTESLLSPVLVWLLLLSVASGTVKSSGLLSIFSSQRKKDENLSYRHRYAFRIVLAELIAVVAVLILLTCISHAPLLSVTGNLFPSSFSASIVPVVAFSLVLFSVTYGVLSGTFTSLVSVFRSLYEGIIAAAPLFLLYIFAAQLWSSFLFVFY